MTPTNQSILHGPGYSAIVPAGCSVTQLHPMGIYAVLPPGSTPPPASPASILIEPVHPNAMMGVLNAIYGLENPLIALLNLRSLGLRDIHRIAPARQLQLGLGVGHLRELDATAMSGQPVRMMLFVIQGRVGIVKVMIGINLFRWTEFMGVCLEFVGGIDVSGGVPAQPQIKAVVDRQHTDQIEYRIVNSDNTTAAVTSLPTVVGNLTIINVDRSITTGNIEGTGIVIGEHSTAKVS